MKPICDILEQRFSVAIEKACSSQYPGNVKAAADIRFGDYQANGVMSIAKRLGVKPRDLAEKIVEHLDIDDICEPPEIAGPGFINLRLRPGWLAGRLAESIVDSDRLGVDPADDAPVTVVDFSGPNIAKQMHVGHLRSTIIGDVIARVLAFRYGDCSKVIRQNHVGDWGTQFGMLLWYFNRLFQQQHKPMFNLNLRGLGLEDFEQFYKKAKQEFDLDPDAAEQSRGWVVELQQGDIWAEEYWRVIRDDSLSHCQEIYNQLNVKLSERDVKGESSYNDDLPSVISALSLAGLLKESDGAQCVFLAGFKAKSGDPLPLIVQKSDGAYLYATTDLAAIRFRIDNLDARRIIYVTDSRQKLHFDMVFACARGAGWAGASVELEHVPFGSVLGADGSPFKTRSGELVKLRDLLDESYNRARSIVDQKNPDLPADRRDQIARVVGIGAVKYADLSSNLVSDYVFDWDKMLSMDGNTAPYMQYAYARVRSIFRKGDIDTAELLSCAGSVELTEPSELALAKLLLRYGEVVESVAVSLRPHLLTNYLFDLAQSFSGFYTICPVLKAAGGVRTSRLLLCYQTARILEHGLGLLGIETIEQM